MQRLVDKFGLYCQHLQSLIPTIKSSKDRGTLRGKFNKLSDAKVLLRSPLFVDVLTSVKIISLSKQKEDVNIILLTL